MLAKTGFYALAVGAALVTGAMLSDDAMAQADDTTVEAGEAAAETVETAARDEDAGHSAKSDLDQSAVQAAPVVRSPRATRTSIRAIAVPKILGSYR